MDSGNRYLYHKKKACLNKDADGLVYLLSQVNKWRPAEPVCADREPPVILDKSRYCDPCWWPLWGSRHANGLRSKRRPLIDTCNISESQVRCQLITVPQQLRYPHSLNETWRRLLQADLLWGSGITPVDVREIYHWDKKRDMYLFDLRIYIILLYFQLILLTEWRAISSVEESFIFHSLTYDLHKSTPVEPVH